MLGYVSMSSNRIDDQRVTRISQDKALGEKRDEPYLLVYTLKSNLGLRGADELARV